MNKLVTFFSTHLLLAVIVMIGLGIGIGQFSPIWFVRIFATFNAVFSSVLSFVVPLLILALVTDAIASTASGAGKMLLWTILFAYLSTIMAAFFAYGASDLIFPNIITYHPNSEQAVEGAMQNSALKPYFEFSFPPIMDTMSALLLSFLLGLTMLKGNMPVLKGAIAELKYVVMATIEKLVLPLLPIYIFGEFLKMTVGGEMKMIAQVYMGVIGIMLVLFIVVLLAQYLIAGWVCHKNPFRLLAKMFPALMTALASSSSAATLPITLRCAGKMGASPNVVNFVIPLCANIHLSGAAVRTLTLAIATMVMYQTPYELAQIGAFILIFSITVLAAPGLPGGVIMAAIGMIESMLGFSPEMIAIMIALSIALDGIGTAVNVCGDGALMMIIDTIMDKSDKQQDTKKNQKD